MQCSSPLYIANNKRSYLRGVDRPLICAPCGKCLSCRQIAQNEWILRAYWHWKEYTDKSKLNGMVFFVTLTYNDDSIPYIVSYDALGEYGKPITITELVRGKPNQWLIEHSKYCFSCFNKRDIDKFFNSVRQHFKRKYGIDNINYLVCSEYGSQFSCRSHYHILVFVPHIGNVSAVVGTENTISTCRKIFEYYWTFCQKNGFTIYSKVEKGGAVVKNTTAIKYVGKYVTKDLNFWKNEDIKQFFLDKNNREEFKHCLPRHYQSKGFGKSLCDYIMESNNPVDVLLEGYKMPVSGSQTMPYFYPIPNYIRRKLMYDVIYEQENVKRLKKFYVNPRQSRQIFPNYRRQKRIVVRTKVRFPKTWFKTKEYVKTLHTYIVPNANYFDFNIAALANRLEKTISRFELDLSSLGLRKYFRNEKHLESFVMARTAFKGVVTFQSISDWLKSFLAGFTFLDLAIYKIVYRGVVPTTRLDSDYLGKYKENYETLLKYKITSPFWVESERPSLADRKKTLNYIEPFDKFELVLDFFDKANRELSYRKAAVAYDRLLQMKKTKQIFQTI